MKDHIVVEELEVAAALLYFPVSLTPCASYVVLLLSTSKKRSKRRIDKNKKKIIRKRERNCLRIVNWFCPFAQSFRLLILSLCE